MTSNLNNLRPESISISEYPTASKLLEIGSVYCFGSAFSLQYAKKMSETGRPLTDVFLGLTYLRDFKAGTVVGALLSEDPDDNLKPIEELSGRPYRVAIGHVDSFPLRSDGSVDYVVIRFALQFGNCLRKVHVTKICII